MKNVYIALKVFMVENVFGLSKCPSHKKYNKINKCKHFKNSLKGYMEPKKMVLLRHHCKTAFWDHY